MLSFDFFKYQGAGNDFVMIEFSEEVIAQLDAKAIKHICNRHFGVGADGLIILKKAHGVDFEMIYYNADGNLGSLCGNGSRCAIQFAFDLGWIIDNVNFSASDGVHQGELLTPNNIRFKLNDIDKNTIRKMDDGGWFVDTGSPHLVYFVEETDNINVFELGEKIRYSPIFSDSGVNVNFVSKAGFEFKIRTYERGVENETLACGTGATAAAVILHFTERAGVNVVLKALGGDLEVKLEENEQYYHNIWLKGPATRVFEGQIKLI